MCIHPESTHTILSLIIGKKDPPPLYFGAPHVIALVVRNPGWLQYLFTTTVVFVLNYHDDCSQ